MKIRDLTQSERAFVTKYLERLHRARAEASRAEEILRDAAVAFAGVPGTIRLTPTELHLEVADAD